MRHLPWQDAPQFSPTPLQCSRFSRWFDCFQTAEEIAKAISIQSLSSGQ